MAITTAKSNFKDGQIERNISKIDYHPRQPDVHFDNTQQRIIIIDEPKLELCARDYHDSIKISDRWHTPLGIFVTVFFTIASAQFNCTWLANFAWIVLGASGFWLFVSAYSAYTFKANIKSPKDFVEFCKNIDKKIL